MGWRVCGTWSEHQYFCVYFYYVLLSVGGFIDRIKITFPMAGTITKNKILLNMSNLNIITNKL